MSGRCVINSLIPFLTVAQATTFISRILTATPGVDNTKSNSELLGQYNTFTLIECAMKCQKDCGHLFGYNPLLMKCRTHQTIFTSGILNEEGWSYYFLPFDCKDILDIGYNNSGVFDIYPSCSSAGATSAYCDMQTMNGGWTAIQRRVDGTVSFKKNWAEYRTGFGVPEADFWIGNDVIHQLTNGRPSYLYASITLDDGRNLYELYDKFSVFGEAEKYKLFLARPATGTLGDTMMNTADPAYNLSGMYFSTYDKDNDRWTDNCASYNQGGWWFNECHYVFLNGVWLSNHRWQNPWFPIVRRGIFVRETVMLIKRHY